MTTFHPADQARVDRIARAGIRGHRNGSGFICDHGRRPNECRTCLELEHAERNSIAVRAAYAFGDWEPCADPACPRREPHVRHGLGDEPPAEAPAVARRPFTGRAYGLHDRLERRRRAAA